MPVDIWSIPLDSDGGVRGSYYLRHRHEVSDALGTVLFERGRSVEPVTGRQLMAFVAALGSDVDLEPADDEARAAMGVFPKSPPATVEDSRAAMKASLLDTDPAPAAEPDPDASDEQPAKGKRGKR